jgi:proteic killer suppression protein
MILSIKHKGLHQFWTKGIQSKIPADQRNKIRLILDTLNDVNEMPDDLLPFKNWNTHKLNGNYQGFWGVTVKENWRLVFRFDGKNILDIDLVDYH